MMWKNVGLLAIVEEGRQGLSMIRFYIINTFCTCTDLYFKESSICCNYLSLRKY
jgi:hypothetical protein